MPPKPAPIREYSPAARTTYPKMPSHPEILPSYTDDLPQNAVPSGNTPQLHGRPTPKRRPVRKYSPTARTGDTNTLLPKVASHSFHRQDLLTLFAHPVAAAAGALKSNERCSSNITFKNKYRSVRKQAFTDLYLFLKAVLRPPHCFG